MALRASNAKFLRATESFVKDVMTREASGGRVSNGQSRREGWWSFDNSGDSPRQGNGGDCGLFTLTSMCLVRNGICLLKKSMYTQGTPTLQRSRRRLAGNILAAGINGEAARWPPQQGVGALPAKAPLTGRAAGGSSCSRKRKSGFEGILIPDSKKLRRWWM